MKILIAVFFSVIDPFSLALIITIIVITVNDHAKEAFKSFYRDRVPPTLKNIIDPIYTAISGPIKILQMVVGVLACKLDSDFEAQY